MIVCLQEVDCVEDYWNGRWAAMGYRSRYSIRPGKGEGCALLWKRSLELLHFQTIHLDDIASQYGLDDPSRTLKRANVAQIAHFYWEEKKRVEWGAVLFDVCTQICPF